MIHGSSKSPYRAFFFVGSYYLAEEVCTEELKLTLCVVVPLYISDIYIFIYVLSLYLSVCIILCLNRQISEIFDQKCMIVDIF